MASDVADIRDLDELEVYGSETQTSVQIASYVFEVLSFTYVSYFCNKVCLTTLTHKEREIVYMC
jgi:hypothetical protein